MLRLPLSLPPPLLPVPPDTPEARPGPQEGGAAAAAASLGAPSDVRRGYAPPRACSPLSDAGCRPLIPAAASWSECSLPRSGGASSVVGALLPAGGLKSGHWLLCCATWLTAPYKSQATAQGEPCRTRSRCAWCQAGAGAGALMRGSFRAAPTAIARPRGLRTLLPGAALLVIACLRRCGHQLPAANCQARPMN